MKSEPYSKKYMRRYFWFLVMCTVILLFQAFYAPLTRFTVALSYLTDIVVIWIIYWANREFLKHRGW